MTVRPVTRLEPLDLKGKAVTAVAMHTQRKLARFLVEDKHADYYFTVKDNQRPLHNVPFCPISASGSNFNPRNIQYIPVVKIFAFLELEQN